MALRLCSTAWRWRWRWRSPRRTCFHLLARPCALRLFGHSSSRWLLPFRPCALCVPSVLVSLSRSLLLGRSFPHELTRSLYSRYVGAWGNHLLIPSSASSSSSSSSASPSLLLPLISKPHAASNPHITATRLRMRFPPAAARANVPPPGHCGRLSLPGVPSSPGSSSRPPAATADCF